MLEDHNIKVQESLNPALHAKKTTLERIFKIQTDRQRGRDVEQEKHLKATIDKEAFDQALAQLITLHNLPFPCVEWPAVHALGQSYGRQALLGLPWVCAPDRWEGIRGTESSC